MKNKSKFIFSLIIVYLISLGCFYFINNYEKLIDYVLPVQNNNEEVKMIDIIPIDPEMVNPTTQPPVTEKVQENIIEVPIEQIYTNPKSNEVPAMSAGLSLMEAVAIGSPFYSQGLESMSSESVNQCFMYRYSEELNSQANYKQVINNAMNILCNRYYKMMSSIETVIRSEAEGKNVLPEGNSNPNEIICGWFNGGFSNVINLVNHSICLNSKTLYHEAAHLLNYRWAYLYCDNCQIPNYAMFNHDNVKVWTQAKVDNATEQFKNELGEMTPESEKLLNEAYNPSNYANTGILERFAEMFARDMYNIETNKERNRLDVILFDNLSFG